MEMNAKLIICMALCMCVLDLVYVTSQTEKVYDCELPQRCPSNTQKYLESYGYINPNRTCIKEDIQAGLRKFQELNIGLQGLEVTGECDNITVRIMSMRRCGCEDIVKMEKKMMPQTFIGPQEFRLGTTKWRKKTLTWTVRKYPRTRHNKATMSESDIDDAFRRAWDIWAKVTSLSFRHEKDSRNAADINIRFETQRHQTTGPYYDFDGEGNVLAHAFFPESGVVHFDDDERFVLNSDRGTELYIVAAHEFGHTLGISHSNIKESLMAPYYRYSERLQLHRDDIGAVQALYGSSDVTRSPTTARPTQRPTQPPTNVPRTTKASHMVPDYCNMHIEATFNIYDTTYVFTREKVSQWRTKTFVYKVTWYGIQKDSKKPIEDMFVKTGSERFPRAHPYRVDAAAYIPDRRHIYLFSGTRAYRYLIKREEGPFQLDTYGGFPKWMDVSEFPERPRAAIAMPYANSNAYYMLIFGTTMVWDWNFHSERVGAWAYPIDVFGRNMPQRVDGAYLQHDKRNVIFFKNDMFYKFDVRRRRIMEDSTVMHVKRDFLKGTCV